MPTNLSIPLTQTNLLPELINDYLNNRDEINILYDYSPNYEGISNAIENKKFSDENRSILYNCLLEQHKNITSEKTLKQIELLKEKHTYTVTTGHQLVIYTGPLFFIYKILHTIKLADELNNKFPDKKFIPIFWMASEDHDLAEIDHLYIFGKKLNWLYEGGGASGRLKTNTLNSLTLELKIICGENINTEKIINIFEKCYDNYSLSEATRLLIYELFADRGIVVINADEKKFKNLLIPVLKQEIKSSFIKKEVEHTNLFLQQNKYKIQVNPRAFNFFYLQENYRERIISENHLFYTHDKKYTWTKDELLAQIEQNPEFFSPNVLMRPLFQEIILPNIVYIGGAGEISYWLQLKSMFKTCNLDLPVLLVRNSFMLIDALTQKKIEKTGFNAIDFLKNPEELISEYLDKNNTEAFDLSDEVKIVNAFYNAIKNKSVAIDASLNNYIEAEKNKTEKFLDNLTQKVKRAQKQKHENVLNQIKSIREKLLPDNALAERKENFLTYFINSGDNLFEKIYEQIQPLQAVLNITYL
jgi:bacillithiol biosynthesis cysteine-adding enzyme BshC